MYRDIERLLVLEFHTPEALRQLGVIVREPHPHPTIHQPPHRSQPLRGRSRSKGVGIRAATQDSGRGCSSPSFIQHILSTY